MKTRSAKNKGRRCSMELKEALVSHFLDYNPTDLKVTTSGETGPDLQCFGEWAKLGLEFECKNCEKISIWSALKQAESHVKKLPHKKPVLVFKRNHSDLYVSLKLSDFLKLIT